MDFLVVFGVESWSDSENLDGEIMSRAAQKNLLGKSLSAIQFPKEIPPTSCITNTPARLDCDFWFVKGPLREKGFRVVITADSKDRIDSVKVSNMHMFLGKWRFPS